jgi:hypothetical protein
MKTPQLPSDSIREMPRPPVVLILASPASRPGHAGSTDQLSRITGWHNKRVTGGSPSPSTTIPP